MLNVTLSSGSSKGSQGRRAFQALKRKEALRSPAPEPKAKAAPAPAPAPELTSSAPQVREAVTDIAELRAALNDIRAMVAEGLMTKTDAKKASKVIAAKLASA